MGLGGLKASSEACKAMIGCMISGDHPGISGLRKAFRFHIRFRHKQGVDSGKVR